VRKFTTLLLLVLLVSLPSILTAQSEVKFAAGVYGGLSIPLLQDDQGSGTAFGFKVRYGLTSLFVVEPNINFDQWGSPDPIDGIDLGIDGSKVTAIGVDFVLGNAIGGMGIQPYFVAGIASYSTKNDQTGYDQSKFGMSGGLGLGVGLSPKLALDIRGKLMVAPQDGGSKKSISIVGGVNYSFGGGQ